MKTCCLAVLLLGCPVVFACETRLDPRKPPVEGEAKQGTADYKLENSLMMALRRDAREGRAPAAYRAETAPPEWSNARGDDVRLTKDGEVISVHRRATGCWVRVARGSVVRELWIPPGEFLDLFPWRGPDVGLLTCLTLGLERNPELDGWTRLAD